MPPPARPPGDNHIMDVASILGLLVIVGSLVFAATAGGGSLGAFVDAPALACVVGGTTAAVLICFPLQTVRGLGRALRKAFFNRPPRTAEIVEALVSLAELARREGLLALELKPPRIDSPFLTLGVQLAVDGTRPEITEEVLRAEMQARAAHHAAEKGLLEQLGRYAPAFGMIGTLLGLVMMLGNMSDPGAIGPGMAVALLTTLYGALLSYALFLPCAEKLSFLNKQELLAMEIIVRGILAIQTGDHPRLVRQKLRMFAPSMPEHRFHARAA
jgi:chemotaxis protein MotA